MNDELTKYYYLLGLRPGASSADLKAAHRDLAKVWHPDRFLHDPQLREKAEQKLKEINEAYDQLRSGKARRQTSSPSSREHHATVNVPTTQKIRWGLVLAPMLIFAAAFLVASRSLLRTGPRVEESSIPAIEEVQHPRDADEQRSAGRITSPKELSSRNATEKGFRTDDLSTTTEEPNPALVRPLPTVTVVIDPSTGMLAKPGCPMKTNMTYPRGNEPNTYCTTHRAQPVPPLERNDASSSIDSRAKSVTKRLLLR